MLNTESFRNRMLEQLVEHLSIRLIWLHRQELNSLSELNRSNARQEPQNTLTHLDRPPLLSDTGTKER